MRFSPGPAPPAPRARSVVVLQSRFTARRAAGASVLAFLPSKHNKARPGVAYSPAELRVDKEMGSGSYGSVYKVRLGRNRAGSSPHAVRQVTDAIGAASFLRHTPIQAPPRRAQTDPGRRR